MAYVNDQLWHALDTEAVAHAFETDPSRGLNKQEVAARQIKYGFNTIEKRRRSRLLDLFVSQLESSLVVTLIIAGIILWFLGDRADAIMIAIVLAINTAVGMYQEGRASRAFDALRSRVEKVTHVLRDGEVREVSSREIVPGDIIELRIGMSIDADARLLDARQLAANESTLTGEWVAQIKSSQTLLPATALLERTNMVYAGTLCEAGTGRAIVVATGGATEFGKIAYLLIDEVEHPTPFQRTIASLSRFIGFLVLIGAVSIFFVGILKGFNPRDMFSLAVAIAISAVPEGLPIAVSVILAIGAERILKRGGLLKRLKSTETLGATTVILTDKTGTLTEGTMAVSHVIPARDSDVGRMALLEAGMLAADAFIENPNDELTAWRVRGDATSRAIVLAARQAGLSKEEFERQHELVDFMPFDNTTRIAIALYRTDDQIRVFLSGAPEEVLDRSRLSKEERKKFEIEYQGLAEAGARVVACATIILKSSPKEFHGLTYLGLIGFRDPVRGDVKASLEAARGAGVRVVVVTGDHALTARAVAHELGFPEPIVIADGTAIENGTADLDRINIYARVLPHQKSLLAEAFEKQGEIVAMTGDGVNDAPALKRAHIGIALGSGTEVAKEVADLVLLDNSFSTIVAAIEEGRTILDNLRKVVTFLLATGFTEVVLIGGALVTGLPLPLLPAQILWINLVGEGFFNFAFAFEQKEHDVLKARPSSADNFFTSQMKALIFIGGLLSTALLFGIYAFLIQSGASVSQSRTLMFLGVAINSFFFVFSLRSLRRPIWQVHLFSNPYLLFAFAAGVLMLVPAFLFRPLAELLRVTTVTIPHIIIMIGVGFTSMIFVEAIKLLYRQKDMVE
ncbi:MAG: HAD-IC family P-type ATPase [Patescibacteria group bacterium]